MTDWDVEPDYESPADELERIKLNLACCVEALERIQKHGSTLGIDWAKRIAGIALEAIHKPNA